jgi:predicted MFS family arabinose efflux permease
MGKLVTGWLVDRITTSLLPLLCFSGPAIGYFVLLQGHSSAWVTAAAVFVLGYCSGAALQLATYLSSRYAGLRSFGTIFGMISALMGLATGIGSAVAGAIYDITGSYALLLTAGIPIAVIAGLSVFRLGPYPEFKTATA